MEEKEARKEMVLSRNLEEDLWVEIFSRIPFKEVIKFSVTSKRWKYLLEQTSMLEIDDENSDMPNSFHKSVEKFLDRYHVGWLRFLRITLIKPIPADTVEKWLAALLSSKLEEIFISLPLATHIKLPVEIFQIMALRNLTLYLQCDWNIPNNISLVGLRSLFLSAKLPDQGSTKRLLEGLRLLTDLRLYSCDWTPITNLSATIPSLKRLFIKHRSRAVNEERVVNLNLENLTTMELQLPMNFELTFAEMNSIDYVDLQIEIPVFDPEDEIEATRVPVRRFVSILNSVRKTNTVALSDSAFRCLNRLEEITRSLPCFDNLYILDLSVATTNEHHWSLMMNVLTQTPRLTTLCLPREIDEIEVSNLEAPNAVINSLETLIVLDFRVSNTQKMTIKYFLKHARKLQLVQIYCAADLESDDAMQIVIRLELVLVCDSDVIIKFDRPVVKQL